MADRARIRQAIHQVVSEISASSGPIRPEHDLVKDLGIGPADIEWDFFPPVAELLGVRAPRYRIDASTVGEWTDVFEKLVEEQKHSL